MPLPLLVSVVESFRSAAAFGSQRVLWMENEWKAEQVLKQLEDIGAKVFFEKQLTSSDVSASGRVVVPKVCARKRKLSLEQGSTWQ